MLLQWGDIPSSGKPIVEVPGARLKFGRAVGTEERHGLGGNIRLHEYLPGLFLAIGTQQG
jgi:hypothetical protein